MSAGGEAYAWLDEVDALREEWVRCQGVVVAAVAYVVAGGAWDEDDRDYLTEVSAAESEAFERYQRAIGARG